MGLFKIDKNKSAICINHSDEDVLEHKIEELLEKNPIILTGKPILYIGRQVRTDSGKKLDLLALDRFGRLIVIELKRGFAPRNIIAQILDYTSWLRKLSEREIEKIAKDYFEKQGLSYKTMHEAFEQIFGKEAKETIGEEIVNILFAKEFSQEVINPAEYLSDNGILINCIQFELFRSESGDEYFLTHNIVGEDIASDEEKDILIPESTKATFKRLINKLTKFIEEKYGDWSTNLGAERLHPFKTYQDIQGTWTCSYIDWLYKDETKFCMEFAIYPEQEGEPQGFCTYVHARKRSLSLTELISSRNDLADLLKGYKDESDTNKPQYAKYLEIDDMKYEVIEQLTIQEFEKIKPLIEAVLS